MFRIYLKKDIYQKQCNLKEAKSNSQDMKNACKFAKNCLEKLENGDFEDGIAKKSFVLLAQPSHYANPT